MRVGGTLLCDADGKVLVGDETFVFLHGKLLVGVATV